MITSCASRKSLHQSRLSLGRSGQTRAHANNRPISFTCEDGQAIIACDYDYMGRRSMKKVTVGGVVQLHQFYLYRGYLQIAALDLTRSNLPALWYTHWDPTEPVATRPLSIRKNGTWYTYGHDLTKNVTEFYKTDGTLEAAYDYTPFGAVSRQGSDNQPFQWSSEVYDAELGMVYYNYRYYNPMDGRWINRDTIGEKGGANLIKFINNHITFRYDYLGLDPKVEYDENCGDDKPNIQEQFKIAQNAISEAINGLDPNSNRYIRFFGKYSSARHKVVSRVFSEIKRILDNATISVDCCGIECEDNWIAYVYVGDGHFQIYLCPSFFNSPGGNDFKSKANTILHELAHEVEMPFSDRVLDKNAPWNPNSEPFGAPYGAEYAEWIAEHDAWIAVTNAENYAAYLSGDL